MALPFARLVALLTPRRSWFQFRLRTMFVLVAVAAVPCVWMAWKMDAKRKERAAVAAIREGGGYCQYRWEFKGDAHPPGPKWLRTLLGDDFFTSVSYVVVRTDATLNSLRDMTCLESLIIDNFQITDDGLSNVQGLTSLHTLSFICTQITDDDLKHLENLSRLELLSFSGTQITDAGLKNLHSLTGLKSLELHDTQITDTGISELRKALPQCEMNVVRSLPWKSEFSSTPDRPRWRGHRSGPSPSADPYGHIGNNRMI